jgi:hypothetical protein
MGGDEAREILTKSDSRFYGGLHSEGGQAGVWVVCYFVVASERVVKERGLDTVKGALKPLLRSFWLDLEVYSYFREAKATG